MDIHQLQLFLAVMNSPSMTRAAEKIHLSPGAVSLQLHNLADELHTELFVRRGKRLIPTPAALRLAELAKQVVTMMGHIEQSFVNDLAQDVHPFHFATGVTTLIYQLGGPLRKLRSNIPTRKFASPSASPKKWSPAFSTAASISPSFLFPSPKPTSKSFRFLTRSCS
jgi:DNA-binding transcriptional LysR family regulator